ncbi:hypothetical protein E3E22_05440 [Thermococcus sp. MV5]|uniref:hypothetical protein n=1 Tax=Thermococcus sp. MV5 TaxID=1638272 RepID=UPI00143A4D22|nr:hypothetical protein [Thermococcus sp. MV5]NJE26071.1 hypothetical protein [Thermococcus sp. MV5]
MRRKLKALLLLFFLLLILPLGVSYLRLAYYDYKYSKPIQGGRLPNEVLNSSIKGDADYSVEVRNGVIMLMENNKVVKSIQVNVSRDFSGYGQYLIYNDTLYVVAVVEIGIVGIEGLYRDIDIVYHLQNRYVWTFDLGSGKLKWYYHEIKGCKTGGGCYPFDPQLKLQDGKLYVNFTPYEDRTLVFSL